MNLDKVKFADGPEMVGTSARELLKILILQKRDEAIQELRNYYYRDARGVAGSPHKVKARILCLYFELYSSMKRSWKKEVFHNLTSKVKSNNIKDLSAAFCMMSDFLDQKVITKFDNRVNIDITDPEGENQAFGL
jgi:hypothetical protein